MGTSYLEKHKTIHSGEEPYSCTHCDKRFNVKSSLKLHEKIHLEEKPFSCSICKKTFVHKGDLKKHEKIHSGDRPFSCSTCNKTFVHRYHLKEHEKVCNKTFVQKDALEKQEMTYKGEEPYQHFTGPEQAVKVNQVDASSSQKVYSQRDPAIWLNVKEEPVDEDSHPTIFETNIQQPIEPEKDKVHVKEESNFEEVTIKEEFTPDE